MPKSGNTKTRSRELEGEREGEGELRGWQETDVEEKPETRRSEVEFPRASVAPARDVPMWLARPDVPPRPSESQRCSPGRTDNPGAVPALATPERGGRCGERAQARAGNSGRGAGRRELDPSPRGFAPTEGGGGTGHSCLVGAISSFSSDRHARCRGVSLGGEALARDEDCWPTSPKPAFI